MGNQAISGLAVLIAIAFIAIAISGCSTAEQTVQAGPSAIAAIPPAEGTSEFHGAAIGADTLRSRVPSES